MAKLTKDQKDLLRAQLAALKAKQAAVRKLQAEADALKTGKDGLVEVKKAGKKVRVDPLRAAKILQMRPKKQGEVPANG